MIVRATLICLALLGTAPATAGAPVTVDWADDRLSVTAELVALSAVLREVAHRTGLEIRGTEQLEEKVTVRLAAMPLAEGLRRLLAHLSYAAVEETGERGTRLTRLAPSTTAAVAITRSIVEIRWRARFGAASSRA